MDNNLKEFIDVFSEMDDKITTLTGCVSTLRAINDAMFSGASNLQDYASAVGLVGDILNKFNKEVSDLIDSGYKLVRESKEN